MDIEKALTGGMFGLMAVAMIVGVAQAMTVVAQPVTPQPVTPPPEFKCPICGQTFSSYSDLEQHMELYHPEIPVPPEAGGASIDRAEFKLDGNFVTVRVTVTNATGGILKHGGDYRTMILLYVFRPLVPIPEIGTKTWLGAVPEGVSQYLGLLSIIDPPKLGEVGVCSIRLASVYEPIGLALVAERRSFTGTFTSELQEWTPTVWIEPPKVEAP